MEPELIQMPAVSQIAVPQTGKPFPMRRFPLTGPDAAYGLVPIQESTGANTGALEWGFQTYDPSDKRYNLDPGIFTITDDGKPVLRWDGVYLVQLVAFMNRSTSAALGALVHMIRVYFTIGSFVDSYEWRQREWTMWGPPPANGWQHPLGGSPPGTSTDDLSQVTCTNRLFFCYAPKDSSVSVNFVPFSYPVAGPWYLEGVNTYLDISYMGSGRNDG